MDDKSIICGLAFQCLYNNRMPECPLLSMDGKSFAEKLGLIEKMGKHEKQEILQQHANCRNKHNGYEKW